MKKLLLATTVLTLLGCSQIKKTETKTNYKKRNFIVLDEVRMTQSVFGSKIVYFKNKLNNACYLIVTDGHGKTMVETDCPIKGIK